ncbi:endocuticle structural protein SgAbd-6-like [Ceratina calcarata]|uniref:Endocuticle structural protein SgAbd-6-like n=1 Tax=Ceratina calcarata TaxID=156304 RepID=A0AAJ7N8C0_9HYME|nr:endocuticle structural protein SgAbd-6-like [Ceratina calcarata]
MKIIIALFAFIAISYAAPQGVVHGANQETVVVKQDLSDNIGVGGYNYGYQLSDGQAKQESAEVVEGGSDGQFLKVRGTFSYVDPETNVAYTVNYVADETGFHAQGDHLPKA